MSRPNKAKAIFVALVVGGLFASLATMAGFFIEKKMSEYAIMAAVSYVLSSLGFLFLVGWTFFRGDFDDVEAPKYKALSAENDDTN